MSLRSPHLSFAISLFLLGLSLPSQDFACAKLLMEAGDFAGKPAIPITQTLERLPPPLESFAPQIQKMIEENWSLLRRLAPRNREHLFNWTSDASSLKGKSLSIYYTWTGDPEFTLVTPHLPSGFFIDGSTLASQGKIVMVVRIDQLLMEISAAQTGKIQISSSAAGTLLYRMYRELLGRFHSYLSRPLSNEWLKNLARPSSVAGREIAGLSAERELIETIERSNLTAYLGLEPGFIEHSKRTIPKQIRTMEVHIAPLQ